MKNRILLKKEKGAIVWGWLVAVLVLGAAISATLMFLPKSKAPESQRAIARAKIPVAPAPSTPLTTPAPAATAPQPSPTDGQAASPAPSPATAPPVTAQPSNPAAGADVSKTEAAQPNAVLDAKAPAVETAKKNIESNGAQQSSAPTAPALPPEIKAAADAQSNKVAQVPAPAAIPVNVPRPAATVAKAPAADSPTPVAVPQKEVVTSPKADAAKEVAAVPAPVSVLPAAQPKAAVEKKVDAGAPAQSLPFTIQLGAFRTKANADALLADLKKRGYGPFLAETRDAQNNSMYAVRCGHYGSRQEAAQEVAIFKKKEKLSAVVVSAK